MFCSKCGYDVGVNANFCTRCGAPVGDFSKNNSNSNNYTESTGDELKIGDGENANSHAFDDTVNNNNLLIEKMNRNKKIFIGVTIGVIAAIVLLIVLPFFM